MNAIRFRILLFMLVMGLAPLTIMTVGLRFLPGPVLPWAVYALLVVTVAVVAMGFSGALSRPLNHAMQALAMLMRSSGAYEPKSWVPREFWALRNSLNQAMANERALREALQDQLNNLSGAVASAEHAAVRSIEALHAVVDACEEGIAFVHGDGHVALVNVHANEWFAVSDEMKQPGVPAQQWLAGVARMFKDADDVAKTWLAWQQAPGSQEAEFEMTEGQTFVVRSFDVRTNTGRLLGRVWIFRDITELRQLEQRLQESQKMQSMGQLAGGIAHDFNNLLTAIRGNLAMADLAEDRDECRDKLENASRAACRATELVGQILGYARRNGTTRTMTDTAQIVEEVRNILKAGLDPKVRLTCHVAKEIWAAAADPMQVEQVLLNLAINARDALPASSGTVEISAANIRLGGTTKNGNVRPPGDYVMLKVKDNGCGIPADVREHIFEAFFTTKAPGKGTGLGLAMSRTIVDQAGGWIEFDSEPGAGTEFRVFLPRSQGDPTEKRETPAEQVPKKPDTKSLRGKVHGTVLVVDDEAPVRSIAVSMLRYLGYRVLEAQDGEEAIQILQNPSLPIDAMIMDICMPKLSGRDTFKQLRAQGINVPVIVCSGFMVDAEEFRNLSQNQGVVDVIQKPYSMETLVSVIGKAVAKGQPVLAA